MLVVLLVMLAVVPMFWPLKWRVIPKCDFIRCIVSYNVSPQILTGVYVGQPFTFRFVMIFRNL